MKFPVSNDWARGAWLTNKEGRFSRPGQISPHGYELLKNYFGERCQTITAKTARMTGSKATQASGKAQRAYEELVKNNYITPTEEMPGLEDGGAGAPPRQMLDAMQTAGPPPPPPPPVPPTWGSASPSGTAGGSAAGAASEEPSTQGRDAAGFISV